MREQVTLMEPVVKTVRVDLGIEDAFRLFTAGMGTWWPLERHSIAVDSLEERVTADSLVFEEREGGRIYEVMSDGAEGTWGRVQAWEPPNRVVFSWKPNLTDGPYTEVEVRFTSIGAGSEVVLEHRGWEQFGDTAERYRNGYDSGWPGVLELFKTAAR
ncbi:MAG TPA: SRPBCC family protein [Actinomycetota bacterium]|nr:SRPBCC family protein [Actinomycetota bacterium]